MHTEATEAIVVAEPAQMTAGGREVFMPIMEADDVMRRHVALANFRDQALKPSVDYGIIPGTGNKPTLLKPGAEKLCTLFGLSCSFSVVEKTEDWTGEGHGGRPFFYYWYRCELRRGDYLVAATDGSCNSLEKKYAKHYSPPDLVNTLQKMAQKRALVGATLLAVNASEFFTQDVEDMDFGHQGTQPASRPQSAARPDNRPQSAVGQAMEQGFQESRRAPLQAGGNAGRGIVEGVEQKETKTGKPYWRVKISGIGWLSTWHQSVGELAPTLDGCEVDYTYSVKGDFKNLETMAGVQQAPLGVSAAGMMQEDDGLDPFSDD